MEQKSMLTNLYQPKRDEKTREISAKSFSSFNMNSYKSWGNLNNYKEDVKASDDAIR